jgi:hypothetical protein
MTRSRLRKKHAFRFLDLPAELRREVYIYLFKAPRGFVRFFRKCYIHEHEFNEPYDLEKTGVRSTRIAINVLFSCRQVYEEALPVLYRINTFCIRPAATIDFELRRDKFRETPRTEYSPKRLQNDIWITNMPKIGQQATTQLEIHLPTFFTKDAWIFIFNKKTRAWTSPFKDMRGMFPNLKRLTLFAHHAFGATWHGGARLSDFRDFWMLLKSCLPTAVTINLDLRMAQHETFDHSDDLQRIARDVFRVELNGQWSPVEHLETASDVIDEVVSTTPAGQALPEGRASFVNHELSWEVEYETRVRHCRDFVDRALGGDSWKENLYCYLDQRNMGHLSRGRDVIDDDSEDERLLFGGDFVNEVEDDVWHLVRL